MGEGASSKPISFGRYVVFYAVLLYYVAFCSVFTIHFVPPFTLRVLHIVWLILIDKRWNVLVCLFSLVAFVRYVCFKSNKEYSTEFEDDLVDLPFPSSSMASELPSYPLFSRPSSLLSPPVSPPSSLLSPPTSPPSSFTSPMSYPHASFTSRRSSLPSSWSSLQSSPRSGFSPSPLSSFTSTPSYPHSYFTSPPSSLLSPWSSPQSSPRSDFSSSSLSSSSPPPPPPPPPFKMRPWKFNYVSMASNVSLSSEDSGDSDIDTKAEKFIAQFRSQLNFEEERLHGRASKA